MTEDSTKLKQAQDMVDELFAAKAWAEEREQDARRATLLRDLMRRSAASALEGYNETRKRVVELIVKGLEEKEHETM